MGRKKLEIKRIEDEARKQVTFSKRRCGLMNKAKQLSVLCEADIAVVVVSARGKVYDFSCGSRLGQILKRYQQTCLEEDSKVATRAHEVKRNHSQHSRFWSCGELLQAVERYTEGDNVEQASLNELIQLEEELGDALIQARLRKTKLMMEYASTLQKKGKLLAEENAQIESELAVAQDLNRNELVAGNNEVANNQIAPNRQLRTLPLFVE